MFSITTKSMGIALTAALAAGLALNVSTASAYSLTKTGKPGFVGTPVTQGWSGDGGNSVMSFPGRWVKRSPGYSGKQTVTVVERIFRWNRVWKKWDFVRKGTMTTTLSPGTATWMHAYTVPIATIGEDLMSVDVTAAWRRADNGRRIGTAYFNYDAVGDYQCLRVPPNTTSCEPFFSYDAGAAGLFFSGAY